jgi:hypothetical protein
MKNLIYPVVIYFIILCHINLAMGNNIQNDLHYYQKISLPYSSNDVTKYYYWEDKTEELRISPNQKVSVRFSDKECRILRKLAKFGRSDSYYPAIYFSYKNILYKGIFFINYTDNDMPVFVFQLNSYDHHGNIIDVIVLDERVNVEGEVLYFNDFTIQQNGTILISKNEQYLLDYDLIDNNGKGFRKGEAKSKRFTYQMSTSGIFKKINETNYKQYKWN